MKLIFCLTILLFSHISPSELVDIDVIKSEMDHSMENYAVGELLVLLSSEPDYKVVSKHLVESMNQKYGKEWIALIGTNPDTTVVGLEITKNTSLLVRFNKDLQKNVYLAKREASHTGNNNKEIWKTILEEAQSAQLHVGYPGNNSAELNMAVNIIRQTIATELKSGPENCYLGTDLYKENGCYRVLSGKVINELKSQINKEGHFMLNVGKVNQCFAYGYDQKDGSGYFFQLGQIFFEKIAYN